MSLTLFVGIIVVIVYVIALLAMLFSIISWSLYRADVERLLRDEYGCKYPKLASFLHSDIRLIIKEPEVAEFVITKNKRKLKRVVISLLSFALLIVVSVLIDYLIKN
mgnify:CR=1 FL=1